MTQDLQVVGQFVPREWAGGGLGTGLPTLGWGGIGWGCWMVMGLESKAYEECLVCLRWR